MALECRFRIVRNLFQAFLGIRKRKPVQPALKMLKNNLLEDPAMQRTDQHVLHLE